MNGCIQTFHSDSICQNHAWKYFMPIKVYGLGTAMKCSV